MKTVVLFEDRKKEKMIKVLTLLKHEIVEKMHFKSIDSERFKLTNQIWNTFKFNDLGRIGSVTGIMKKVKPESIEEFVVKYIELGDERKRLLKAGNSEINASDMNRNYGRTKDELIELSKEFLSKCQSSGIAVLESMGLEEAKGHVCERIFAQTFGGRGAEILARNKLRYALRGTAFVISDATPSEDSLYAVDLIITHKATGQQVYGIQVKPYTYTKYDDKKIGQKQMNQRKNATYITKIEEEMKSKNLLINNMHPSVFYLFYTKKSEALTLINYDKLVDELKALNFEDIAV